MSVLRKPKPVPKVMKPRVALGKPRAQRELEAKLKARVDKIKAEKRKK